VRYKQKHPTDEVLLQYVDREITFRHASDVGKHLDGCERCCQRKNQLETTLAEFVSLHNERLDADSSVFIESRPAFRSRLSQVVKENNRSEAWIPHAVLVRFAYAAMVLAVLATGTWITRNLDFHSTISQLIPGHDEALPIRKLTPGATLPISLSLLCEKKEELVPAVDDSVTQQVFQEYGLPISSRDAYELDFLVTPELGGSSDVRNLWPEPHSSITWNSRVKDQLEDHLHEAVCQGTLPLSTAQKEISGDWIAAYKKYFRTNTPLTDTGELPTGSNFRQVSHMTRLLNAVGSVTARWL
jgi:hypothetical protein